MRQPRGGRGSVQPRPALRGVLWWSQRGSPGLGREGFWDEQLRALPTPEGLALRVTPASVSGGCPDLPQDPGGPGQ